MSLDNGSQADTRTMNLLPQTTYSFRKVSHTIRLGNGGAGPSGIFGDIARDYQASCPTAGAVAWYQNISPLSLAALRNGEIDIALTYEREQEAEAHRQGWIAQPRLIFNDHFVIIGPTSNPAGLHASDSPEAAFEKIVHLAKCEPEKPLFLSRHDGSATHLKEREVFERIGLRISEDVPNWYICQSVFPKDALRKADKEGLYTLTDHGTLGMLQHELMSTTKYVMGGELLRNPCNALLRLDASAATREFMAYLGSERGQQVIATFGERQYGQRLYTQASQPDLP